MVARQRTSLLRRPVYAVPMIAVAVLGMTGISAAQEQAPASAALDSVAKVDVPPELVPPAGNALSAVFRAEGVQIYQCTGATWVFVEPSASLQGRAAAVPGRQNVIHFRGPSWQSIQDGSLVEGAVAVALPTPGTIPRLLLRATKTRGDGVLGGVTFVQRLATEGGTAPAGACAAGATTGVPYKAVYRFFTAAS
jgi:hypothetical protein